MSPSTLTRLSPNAAALLLTLGVLLVYVELNRPGRVIPGALGLLAVLFAAAALLRQGLSLAGLALVALALALFLLALLRAAPLGTAVAATLALVAGLYRLLPPTAPPGNRIGLLTAALCGGVLGGVTATLTHLARRARANKRLD